MRRFLHGRSYDQMIADGDLPTDRGLRLAVIISESYVRGVEQALIGAAVLGIIGATVAAGHYWLGWWA